MPTTKKKNRIVSVQVRFHKALDAVVHRCKVQAGLPHDLSQSQGKSNNTYLGLQHVR